jgi:sulfotransferase family protein
MTTRRPHILVVNGRKVVEPVFVIGAPHSGTDLLARALKRSAGFHLTIGQPSVTGVVQAFARSPSIQRGHGDAVAAVLRDGFAQGWQVTAHGCLACSGACREAGGVTGAAACIAERDIRRYGDASPDLMYCADELVDAFPDARLVQIIRDGRDVVAAMLADSVAMAWFRPGVSNVDSEFPNPFFGIETADDLAAWPGLSLAGKCAMRWRGSVRVMARLRNTLPAEGLTTLRYEDVIRHPAAAARAVSGFIGADVARIEAGAGRGGGDAAPGGPMAIPPGGWRHALNAQQVTDIEQVAGADLRRVGYGG